MKNLPTFKIDYSILKNKTVLITGGTGSFGSNCVRLLLKKTKAKKIIIFSRDEYKQYILAEEFKIIDKHKVCRYFLGDVRDYERLNTAFRGVDFVIHAAALKHVPSNEYNPFECLKTNVFGSENVVRAALNNNVKIVVSLSTDKACNPVNLYGASKLAADKVFLATNYFASDRITKFKVVRYGNVIASRGSVISLFKKKLKEGCDCLPITDPAMTRFWINVDESVNFVLSCLNDKTGGDLFIPKLPTMRIIDIAKALSPKIKFKIIGIRPGEKLHETLITKEESRDLYEFSDRYILKVQNPNSRTKAKVRGGKKVLNEFEYTSNKNYSFFNINQIKELFKKIN